MAIIYIDNFKGFYNTYLSLKDVNFFVGENSTGKNSPLKLINNLSSPNFWVDQEFNSDRTSLGYYSEIANLKNRKKYFQLSIIGNHYLEKDEINAIKLKYKNENDFPILTEACFIARNTNVQIVVARDNIEYRYSLLDKNALSQENKLDFFVNWVEECGLRNKSLKN